MSYTCMVMLGLVCSRQPKRSQMESQDERGARRLEYLEHAARLRSLAAAAKDSFGRELFLGLAATYDLLAIPLSANPSSDPTG